MKLISKLAMAIVTATPPRRTPRLPPSIIHNALEITQSSRFSPILLIQMIADVINRFTVFIFALQSCSAFLATTTSVTTTPLQKCKQEKQITVQFAGNDNNHYADQLGKEEDFFGTSSSVSEDALRFCGIGRLYDDATGGTTEEESSSLKRLSEATVAVIGIGGVGSWTAEALCRSGIGNLVLMDLDDICISNTNRQSHATSSNVGKMKVDVMKQRLNDINPRCNVTTVMDFVSTENAYDMIQGLLPDVTCVVDAIDGAQEKTALISACARLRVPIVTCGGAAGRKDPTQIVCDDIIKVKEDRLLFWCRKDLRQRYGFPKGPAKFTKASYKPRRWRIFAVYSKEVQKTIKADNISTSSLRTCDGALGTACFVTGAYGFVAAGKVVSMIASDKLVRPRFRGSALMQKMQNGHISDFMQSDTEPLLVANVTTTAG